MPAVLPTPALPAGALAPTLPSPALRSTRALAVAALLALIALDLAWELWLAPTGQRTLVLKVLPLLLPLPGLLKYRLYTYRWLSLMLWLYVVEAAVRINGPAQGGSAVRWLALSQALLCLLLFAACSLHVRWRLRHKAARP